MLRYVVMCKNYRFNALYYVYDLLMNGQAVCLKWWYGCSAVDIFFLIHVIPFSMEDSFVQTFGRIEHRGMTKRRIVKFSLSTIFQMFCQVDEEDQVKTKDGP
uniref:Uncharacterized protein n=1 Tax=Anopheles quadriannulatus TaxID=34691 RepID=A0A182XTI7_ANOQN